MRDVSCPLNYVCWFIKLTGSTQKYGRMRSETVPNPLIVLEPLNGANISRPGDWCNEWQHSAGRISSRIWNNAFASPFNIILTTCALFWPITKLIKTKRKVFCLFVNFQYRTCCSVRFSYGALFNYEVRFSLFIFYVTIISNN